MKDVGVYATVEITEPQAAAVYSLSPLAGGDPSLKVYYLTHIWNNLMPPSPVISSQFVTQEVELLISSLTK
jgi:hypothetical protein